MSKRLSDIVRSKMLSILLMSKRMSDIVMSKMLSILLMSITHIQDISGTCALP
jgi:ABC-type Na+ efflux pump permease subunit